MVEPLISKRLIIPYQSAWPDHFAKIREVLSHALKPNKVRIEHIGSTAVKDLAAKPIIDIDIIFYQNDQFKEIKGRLEILGYLHAGNQGIEGREVLKRDKRSKHEELDTIAHHLYLCHAENHELQRHLAFRNHLRKHDDLREVYERLKLEIAEKANQDRKVYALLKEQQVKDFIESVLVKTILK